MKRILTVTLCILLIMSLGACAGKDEQKPVDGDTTTENAGTGIPNPMVEVSQPDFDEALGFSINGWPAEYAYEHIFVIAGAVSEIDFIVDENALSFRVAKEEEGEISGVYDAFDKSETAEISGISVAITYVEGQTGLATWTKEGYTFSLYIKSGASLDNLSQVAEKIINSINIGSFTE